MIFTAVKAWFVSKSLIIISFGALSMLGVISVQSYTIRGLKLEAAQTEAKHAKQRAEQESTARIASENFRRTEADLRARVDSAQGNYDALQKKHAVTIDAHRASDDKLRDQLATYASGGGSPADNTCAAERERAEALGLLLADGVRLQNELAGHAESASDSVRALKEAWPKP